MHRQWGITLTSASKVAFIAGFDLFLTPIFGLFIPTFKLNADPQLSTWLAVVASLIGLFLLSGASLHDFEMGMGETLTLISTVFWTLHITYTDISTSYVDTMAMMCVQMGCVTFLSAATAIWVEPHQWFWSHMAAYWHWIFFLAIVDGLGFLLMAQGQTYAPPTHAAIILSLEGVFASVASFLFIGEHLSSREVLGCAIMLAATLMAEIGVPCLDRLSGDRPAYALTASALELAASKGTSPSKLGLGAADSKYGSKGASFLPPTVLSIIKATLGFYSGVRTAIGQLAFSIRNRFIKVKTSEDLYPSGVLPATMTPLRDEGLKSSEIADGANQS